MTTPIATVGTSTPTASTSTSTAATDNSSLSSQAFLQLMVAQLQYQDPSSPVDTSSLMSQTATMNQIQTMQQLTAASTAQLASQQLQTAASMVGRTVTYQDATGASVSGYVSSATLGASPTLKIGSADVPLSAVTQIVAPATP